MHPSSRRTKALYSKGSMEEAIHNSIMDFTKCKLSKSDKAFSVEFQDGDPYIVTIGGMLDNTLLAYPTGRITYILRQNVLSLMANYSSGTIRKLREVLNASRC